MPHNPNVGDTPVTEFIYGKDMGLILWHLYFGMTNSPIKNKDMKGTRIPAKPEFKQVVQFKVS